MQRFPRLALLALSCLLLLSACTNSLPDHVRYVPKDAMMVVGLHTGQLQKKIAWSAVTGSSMLQELRNNPKAELAVKEIENAGLDYGSTVYFYSKPDTRYEEGTKMAVVVPLDDAGKWEAYVRKVFPGTAIKKVKDRSEAALDNKYYAGWNDKVLIVTNNATRTIRHLEAAADTTGGLPGESETWDEDVMDPAATAAEMEAAFNMDKDASIRGNDRFRESEKAGHDLTMWVNYDALMNSSQAKAGMGMAGFALNNALWKNSAMAAAFDFKDGLVEGDMRYYSSDSLKGIAREFGRQDVDGDMLSRVPGQNLNLVAGYHLSPAALKMLLDKLGVAGMANMYLMQQNTNVDEILNAFTGDMVVAINNFKVAEGISPAITDSLEMPQGGAYPPFYEPDMDYVYAAKINNKASFDKLFGMVAQQTGLQPSAANTYTIPLSDTRNISMVIGDKYFAVSNNAASAQAFLQGKGGAMPDAAHREVAGHPAGLYVDVQSFLSRIGPMMRSSGQDSVAVHELRNLLSQATLNGGEYKDESNRYHMAVNFVNKKENSLLQLLYMAQRIQAAKSEPAVAAVH